jgi:TolA-binding protein
MVLTLGAALHADEFSTAAGYYSTGQFQEAIAAFDRLMMLAPEHPQRADAEFYCGEARLQLRQFEQAAQCFETFLAKYSGHGLVPRARFRLGECRYLAGKREAAIELLRRFLHDYPDDAMCEYALPYLGVSLFESADAAPGAARQVLTSAIDRYPRGALAEEVSFRLMELDERENKTRDMQQRLVRLQQDFPHSTRKSEWHYWQGLVYERSKRPLDAIKHYEHALATDADEITKARALSRAAQLLIAQGDDNGAAKKLAAICSLSIDAGVIEESYAQRVRLAIKGSKQAEAKRLMAEFRERFPGRTGGREMQRLAGEIAILDRDFGRAIDAFQQLAQEAESPSGSPSAVDRAVTAYQLASALYQSGQYVQAHAALEKMPTAELPEPLVARIEYARGSICQRLNKTDLALAAWARVRDIDPQSSIADRARWKLVTLLSQEARWDDAFREYRPWDPSAEAKWFYRQAGHCFAEAAYAAGRYDQAASAFALLLSHLKEADDVAYALSGRAWCHLRQQQWNEAAEVFKRLIEQFPDNQYIPSALLARAFVLESAGDHHDATALYRDFIERFPAHPDRWRADVKAAELLLEQQAYNDALSVLQDGLQAAQDEMIRQRLRFLLACLHQRSGQVQPAREIFQQIQSQGSAHPFWADATYRLAKAAFEQHELTVARDLLDQLLEAPAGESADRMRPFSMYLKARIAAQQNDWPGVLSCLDDLRAAYPNSPLEAAAIVWSIESLHQMGDFEKVKHRVHRLRETAVELKPQWRRLVQLREAQSMAETQQWQSALDLAQSLADRVPHDARWAEANLVVGRCNAELDRPEEARAALLKVVTDQAISNRAAADAAWWFIGETFLRQGQVQSALDAYMHVRPNDTSRWYAAALFRAGECFERLHRNAEADRVFKHLAELSVDSNYRQAARERISASDGGANTSPSRLRVSTQRSSQDDANTQLKGNP